MHFTSSFDLMVDVSLCSGRKWLQVGKFLIVVQLPEEKSNVQVSILRFLFRVVSYRHAMEGCLFVQRKKNPGVSDKYTS